MTLFRPLLAVPLGLATLLGVTSVSSAQSAGKRNDLKQQQQQIEQESERVREQIRQAAQQPGDLTSDPQLLALHKDFVVKAEKLAIDYERKKQFDKAREVYASLVRLMPDYAGAEESLGRVLGSQSAQDRRVTTVLANQTWQDSGAVLKEGMPVQIATKGTWSVVIETDSGGAEIPEDQRPRDPRIRWGTLIGVIANTPAELQSERPIALADGAQFLAKRSGRLYLRMFDTDPQDNEGKLMVMIQSTFD